MFDFPLFFLSSFYCSFSFHFVCKVFKISCLICFAFVIFVVVQKKKWLNSKGQNDIWKVHVWYQKNKYLYEAHVIKMEVQTDCYFFFLSLNSLQLNSFFRIMIHIYWSQKQHFSIFISIENTNIESNFHILISSNEAFFSLFNWIVNIKSIKFYFKIFLLFLLYIESFSIVQ